MLIRTARLLQMSFCAMAKAYSHSQFPDDVRKFLFLAAMVQFQPHLFMYEYTEHYNMYTLSIEIS